MASCVLLTDSMVFGCSTKSLILPLARVKKLLSFASAKFLLEGLTFCWKRVRVCISCCQLSDR